MGAFKEEKKIEKYAVLDIETTGLNPIDCQITCICTKDSDGYWHNGFVGEGNFTEEDLIQNIADNLQKKGVKILITKNGKMFDIPFMIVRNPKTTEYYKSLKHIDLQEYTQGRVKLSDMAFLLGTENKSGKGEDAIKLWKDKEFKKLVDYCKQDVEVTEQCFKKLQEVSSHSSPK